MPNTKEGKEKIKINSELSGEAKIDIPAPKLIAIAGIEMQSPISSKK